MATAEIATEVNIGMLWGSEYCSGHDRIRLRSLLADFNASEPLKWCLCWTSAAFDKGGQSLPKLREAAFYCMSLPTVSAVDERNSSFYPCKMSAYRMPTLA